MALAGMIPEPIREPKVLYNQLFINNEWVPSDDGGTYAVINPTTTEEICRVAEAKQKDIDKAVAAAKKAFEPGSAWRKTTYTERGVLLNKLADLVKRDQVYLSSLETLNNGKVYSRVYASDLQFGVIDFFRYFAGWTNKLSGKTLSLDDDVVAYTKHEPLGVCGAIIPWNVPLTMLAWKTAPCLAAGNTLVLKPSEQTPLTALYFASLVKEAGFPPGVFNVVQGFGATAGSALSHHMDVAKISFTGSVPVGRLIQKASADSNFKNMTLELGGKNPLIIFPDAQMCDAVEMAHVAIFSQGGQICCAGSLTYVHEDIYDEFVQKSVARAKSRKLGDPFDLSVEQGPQITKQQQEIVLGIINDGLKKGGTLHCGGGKPKDLKGYFIEPAVITDLDDDHVLVREEIFGPVQIILKFTSTDEVIKRCNASKFGLAAGVLTKNINNALKVANGVRAGSMWVNCFFAMRAPTPFGGYKMSGIGRDLGEESLRSYTEVKSVVIKPSSTSV